MNSQNIVRYWHSVELLQPQAVPKLKKRDSDYQPFFQDIPTSAQILPWMPANLLSRQRLPNKRVWSHTLYAHLYSNVDVSRQLEALYGADKGYKEPQHRLSALYALKFNDQGMMLVDSLVLSSEAWFVGCAIKQKDWTRGFEETQDFLREQTKSLLGGVVLATDLSRLTNYIRQALGLDDFFADESRVHRFRSAPINPNKPEQEDDPLNSFLLSDLADMADALARGETSEPLARYLSHHDSTQRLHLDKPEADLALIDRLAPSRYAAGCWPAERHLGLVHSQQLAVNSLLQTLSNGTGIMGVNGPPGTGKTTLLRDLIAAVVTERADVLASLGRASDAFIQDGRESANDGGRERFAYQLNPRLFGFEMVVASSNNGAVENVTLELPQLDKVDPSWLPDAEYFSELGELTSGKPAWAMISSALGSKAKRTQFVDRFFYGKRPPNATKTRDESAPSQPTSLDNSDLGEDLYDGDPTPEASVANSTDDQPAPKGMREWLAEQAAYMKSLSSTDKNMLWRAAVKQYQDAKSAEQAIRAQASDILERIQAVISAKARVHQKEQERQIRLTLRSSLNDEQAKLETRQLTSAREQLQRELQVLEAHLAKKPGFLANLFSLWGAHRTWAARQRLLDSAHALAKDAFDSVQRQVQRLVGQLTELNRQLAKDEQEINEAVLHASLQIEKARNIAQAGGAKHLQVWLEQGRIGRGSDIELLEPWIIEGSRQARAKVFIEALKLHRVFFQIEASRLRANLDFITSTLTGSRYRGVSPAVVRSAWASLFMVVPVLSSTFASFARSFGSLGCGEIGWLLVDEAGQATPQAAVGALWRARRAVLVGDPLQLEPIVTVSDAVLEHMRNRYQVDAHWLPNRQSAQTLADQATPWGRMAGPKDKKCWVGLPLVVHRRCDKPMFDLANRIAYDGAMVYGTLAPSPVKETPARLPTGWVHASGRSSGNWVDSEGKVLERLLAMLDGDGVPLDSIAVITPFQDVRNQLKDRLHDKIVRGTIHTMQGKEAAVIILVLGGSSENGGAREWAVSKPNLLNVAVTRAKRRLYVIGDRNDWAQRKLFCEVMELLPAHPRMTADSPA
ncbi:AAA domain-containing protein [Pseudomonas sp. SJZ103]|uniref:DEAD/DEAH box helicase n=1 Tax=unclassified Pseudomonas TaxID=196821 RepID=UPI00119D61B8|nr:MULTISPECIES: ATP-binding protein [unclassified Pseudomonas]TWC63554.1 AAA domain-containing protein [Pseudomonas sp. SJZ103]TWC80599.1 AAA domain-containing protein [Pseudomonas sp. SJZ094]